MKLCVSPAYLELLDDDLSRDGSELEHRRALFKEVRRWVDADDDAWHGPYTVTLEQPTTMSL